MKTTLIAMLFLFPNVEITSIHPTHHQTNWSIQYEFKANDLCYISIKQLDCFISGDLWNNTNHKQKIKLKNLHLFIKDNDKNYKYTNDVCGASNHKRFEIRIENEQRRVVEELPLTPGEKFYIIINLKHQHEPESAYDILRGYLDIRLILGHNTFNKYIVLAQQHRIIPPKITLSPPLPDYLTTNFYRTPPHSIILSSIINEADSHYFTSVHKVFPGEKIKISFYYYLSSQYKSELELYITSYDLQGIPDDGQPIILKRKFAGWQHYEKILIIPANMTKMGLKFDSEIGIVFIDDITIDVLGCDP